MKSLCTFLLLLLPICFCFGQEYKSLKLVDGKSTEVVNQSTINLEAGTLTYLDELGNEQTKELDDYSQIYYRKGSNWLSGLAGGLLGGTLGAMLANSATAEEGESWHGIGPVILGTTVVGTVIGAFIPRYKKLDLNDNKTVSLQVTEAGICLVF